MTSPSISGTRRHSRTRIALALGLTVLLAVIIGWATLTPPDHQPDLAFVLPDKVVHALAFAALILPSAALAVQSPPWVLAAALAYGGIIELIQPHVGRSLELGDMVANVVGLALGLATAWILRRTSTRSRNLRS